MSVYNFKTTDIKGKPYVEVNERIKYFRTHPDYQGWRMNSDIIEHSGGAIIIKATIYDSNGDFRASGFGREKDGDGFINKSSYVENCETSAWGRALGNLGIGIDTSIASADEVNNAILQQNSKQITVDTPKLKNLTPSVQDRMMKAIESGKASAVEDSLSTFEDSDAKIAIINYLKDWADGGK